MDLRINDVVTDLVVTEGVESLSAQEVKKLVGMVLELVKKEHDKNAQRDQDTKVKDRVFDFEAK